MDERQNTERKTKRKGWIVTKEIVDLEGNKMEEGKMKKEQNDKEKRRKWIGWEIK